MRHICCFGLGMFSPSFALSFLFVPKPRTNSVSLTGGAGTCRDTEGCGQRDTVAAGRCRHGDRRLCFQVSPPVCGETPEAL